MGNLKRILSFMNEVQNLREHLGPSTYNHASFEIGENGMLLFCSIHYSLESLIVIA